MCIRDSWKRLGLSFDGIYTGFLGSKKQIAIVKDFIEEFGLKGCKVIIDPVMGDDGRTYATYTKQMCREMKKLVEYADILTCLLYTSSTQTISSNTMGSVHYISPEQARGCLLYTSFFQNLWGYAPRMIRIWHAE